MEPTYLALDRQILIAAEQLHSGDWGAWIGVVEGHNHHEEYKGVLATGTKVSEAVARAVFPQFVDLPYGF